MFVHDIHEQPTLTPTPPHTTHKKQLCQCTPQKHTHTHTAMPFAFTYRCYTPPRHTLSSLHTHTHTHTQTLPLAIPAAAAAAAVGRRADMVQCVVQCRVVVVVILCWEERSSLDGGDRHLIRLSLALPPLQHPPASSLSSLWGPG